MTPCKFGYFHELYPETIGNDEKLREQVATLAGARAGLGARGQGPGGPVGAGLPEAQLARTGALGIETRLLQAEGDWECIAN